MPESVLRRIACIAVVLAALSLVGCPQPASVYIAVEDLPFDDSTLRACAITTAKREGWVDAGHVTRLRCVNPVGNHITSLAGVENLVNLEELDLAHNAITDITGVLN